MSKRIGILSVCLVLLLVAGSVAVARPLAHKKIVEDTGTIKCVKEIYLIYGDRGTYFAGRLWKIYYPVNLPERFKKDGLRVRFKGYVAFHPGIWKDLAKVRKSLPEISLVLPIKIVSIEELHEEKGLCRIYGRVIDAESGEGIKGARVKAREFITYTGDDGYYELILPAGKYVVEVSKRGYEKVRKEVYLKEGEEKEINFELRRVEEKLAVIHGRVFEVSGELRKPLPGARVMLFKIKSRIVVPMVLSIASRYGIVKPVYQTTTNESGYYELKVKPGSYIGIAVKDGYRPDVKKILAKAGEDIEVNFELKKPRFPLFPITIR